MTLSRTEQAARNNAVWCDTVCRAHGAPGEFYDALWTNSHALPAFYPNVVTLSGQQATGSQLAHIQALASSGLPASWAVKDSFCSLPLADHGFQLLFEASWLWREPSPITLPDPSAIIRWDQVCSDSEMACWEVAWSGDSANSLAAPRSRLFLPSLLAEQDFAFFAAYQGEDIVAGAAANRTDRVVGLSNLFVPAAEPASYWAGCIAAVQAHFPGLPLVGYERGPELAIARAVGFEVIEDLRVWMRQTV